MVLEVLDPTQEQAAKTIGDGHRIIAGVAGWGKTILLQILRQAAGRRGGTQAHPPALLQPRPLHLPEGRVRG